MAKTTNNVLMGIGLVILLAMSTFSVLAFVEQVTCKNLDLYSEQENYGMCGNHSNKKKGTSEGYGGRKKKKEEGYGGHGTSEGYGGHGCGDHSNKKKGTSEGYGERKKKKKY